MNIVMVVECEICCIYYVFWAAQLAWKLRYVTGLTYHDYEATFDTEKWLFVKLYIEEATYLPKYILWWSHQ